jgi:hypothetical protein
MTRGFVEAIGSSVPCASDVRECFTLKPALRNSFKPQSSARMTRGFEGALGFSVPCASEVREGFTPGTALRRTFKPQSLRGFVRAIGLSFPFERGGIRLHAVFRRGSIGRYIDRMLKPDCSDVSGDSPGTSQVSCCVSIHLRLCWRSIRRSLYSFISAAA